MKDIYKIIVLIVTATNIVIAGDYSYRVRDSQVGQVSERMHTEVCCRTIGDLP